MPSYIVICQHKTHGILEETFSNAIRISNNAVIINFADDSILISEQWIPVHKHLQNEIIKIEGVKNFFITRIDLDQSVLIDQQPIIQNGMRCILKMIARRDDFYNRYPSHPSDSKVKKQVYSLKQAPLTITT